MGYSATGNKLSYDKIDYDIIPLPNDIWVRKMDNGEGTYGKSKIIIANNDITSTSGIRPRWAEIWKVGEKVDYTKPGDWVLIDHGRWSYGRTITHEDNTTSYVQKADPNGIMIIADSEPEDKRTQCTGNNSDVKFREDSGVINPKGSDILVHKIDQNGDIHNGIIHLDDSWTDVERERWARVWKVGPNQTEIKAGDWVLLRDVKWDGITYVNTNFTEDYIMSIDYDNISIVSEIEPEDKRTSYVDYFDSKPITNNVDEIAPLPNGIIVKNLDMGEGHFGSVLLVKDANKFEPRPRWAEVYKIGEKVDYVEVGEWILLDDFNDFDGLTIKIDGVDVLVHTIDTSTILAVNSTEPEDKRTHTITW